MLRSSIPASIEMNWNLDGTSIVNCDPTEVHQIVMNLCTNSFQAIKGQGGKITVDLHPISYEAIPLESPSILNEGKYIELNIKDNGHGIPDAIIDRIFEPYFTTKKQGEGTGLGLSIVHRVIQSYKGDIIVSSKANQGTEFRIFLPVIAKEIIALEKDFPRKEVRGEGHILFLDDEIAIVQTNRILLESKGFKVSDFITSREAFDAFRKSPDSFDIILTDMTMPEMDGVRFTAEIRKISKKIPIVLCTGYSELVNEHNIEEFGINALLLKPTYLPDLVEKITELLNKKNNGEK